ncbi:D-alanyl-D-alanine carboxypeptidase/D-alanyl-D-alanine-endopeptidase [Planctomycetota bacterium]|nr:D-alanyl-D-alanine carboxypeptidase/D-alanyl-D-alanine-endopeptidase [Planctomycetota bacterium]
MVTALLLLGASAVSSGTSLQKSIGAKAVKAEGKRGTFGAKIIDLDSGKTLYERNAGTALIPASNMKLYTSAAALCKLGHDFEFKTRVYADGSISNGTLDGDVLLIGGGDPNISGRFNGDDPLAVFKEWAGVLKKAGITKVTGELVYDSTLFGGDAYAPTWPKDDQYMKWYCAQVSALAFNDNCVGIRVTPAKAGQKGRIEVIPATSYVNIVNETKTASGKKGAKIGIIRKRGSNTITVKGTVYEKATWGYFTDVTVNDPAAYAATVLHETFEAQGISFAGNIKPQMLTNERLGKSKVLVDHKFLLATALKPVNTNSQNLHAEMLYRQLGLHLAGKGTFATGKAAIEKFLDDAKIDRTGMVFDDGSGMSRSNRITPDATVALLKYMAARDDFEVFKESMAIGGESGTLEKRLKGKSVKGKVFAKTGYINGVRSLSGYLFTGERRIVFSMLMNSCVYTKQMQDEILELLAKATA